MTSYFAPSYPLPFSTSAATAKPGIHAVEKSSQLSSDHPIFRQLVQDIYEWTECAWVVGLRCAGDTVQPLCRLGESVDLDGCSRAVTGMLHEFDSKHIASTMPVGANATLPQVIGSVRVRNSLVGVLALGPKNNGKPYNEDELDLIESASAHVGSLLQNDELSGRVSSTLERVQQAHRELEMARRVQRHLMPACLAAIPHVDYYGENQPVQEVGGDFFDFSVLPGGRLGIAIGDVSGKGIPAAIMMAGVQASLRGLALQGTGSVAELLDQMNRLICDVSTENFFTTLFYAQYDMRNHSLDYVNAGHEPPLLFRREAGVQRLDVGGTVLGLTPRSAYRQGTVALEPEDLLVAYTDGVRELTNSYGEEWGEEGIVNAVRCAPEREAVEIVRYLQQTAQSFSGEVSPTDDQTLVAIRVFESTEQLQRSA